MNILIAGSSGMVGSAAARFLANGGHTIARLVRRTPGAGEVYWNPDAGEIDAAGLEGFDGVVHLASMPWPMRWTDKAKEKIRANRLATNGLLAEALAKTARQPGTGARKPGLANANPKVLVCASGMGYYPDSGEAVITEDSPAGTRWLARLQQEGEAATAPASAAGIRVVHLRIPPVLGGAAVQRGGAWAGDGRQWVSWVGRDELAAIIAFALACEQVRGPVNAVSPNPLRNADFARATTAALGQKSCMRLPAFVIRMILGEMGEEFILSSRRMMPAKLLDAGYTFRYPALEDALRHELEEVKRAEK